MAADTLMRYPREFEQIVPEQVSQMWLWHAAEETEHKAVCFDVMQHVGGRWAYLNRVAGMLLATPFFLLFVLLIPSIVLSRHRPPVVCTGRPKFTFPEGSDASRFAGRGMVGLLRELIPWKLYFSYYRPSFHPWTHDNSHAIAAWQARYPDFGMRRAETSGVGAPAAR
jgi:predicted metal-dependent hydrolase